MNLEPITGYGFQIVKISEDNSKITSLVINIQSIEAQSPDGEWVVISSEQQQWDIWRELEKTFTIDHNITGYSKIRLIIESDGSNVTLADGSEIELSVSSLPIEVDLLNSSSAGNAESQLKLSLGQGTASTYMLPNLQIELSTNKLTAEVLYQ